jgi:arsenate reductase
MPEVAARTPISPVTIYHNPRCGKSRATLALIAERGIDAVIVEYLKTPPGAAELEGIINKLGISAEQLVRKSEEIYRSEYAGRALSDDAWIAAMVKHPILIQPPIVVKGNRAVLGRPPENVLQLL